MTKPPENSDELELEAWRRQFAAEVGRAPERSGRKALYTREDLVGVSDADGFPGAYPFVRGARASMYVGRPWTLRQYAGFSTVEESNAFYRRCLEAGQRGLSVAFDLATHRGFDSDDERVVGDVGKAGVAVDSVEDVKRLFAGIPLDQTSVSMTMNGAVLPVFAMFLVAAEEQGADLASLSGTMQNDILKEFMVRNTYIYPPEPSMRIVSDVIEYCSRHLPRYNPVSISGYHMHEAGAPAHLELGLTLADGLEYVKAAVARGLDVDAFAPRLSFFFAVGSEFLVEVAKLRAARLSWARLMRARFSPKRAASLRLRMHCQTSGVSLTAQEPHNNLMRTTLQALAAVLGGTQSLHTNAFDEALALPSDFAARLARNTQLILQHETGIADVIDPLGGSYAIESLTRELADRADEIVREVEGSGGMVQAIGEGWPQARIARAAADRQARIERGQEVVVGVNRHRESGEAGEPVPLRHIDDVAVRSRQLAELERLRETRDGQLVEASLDRLRAAARAAAGSPGANLVEAALPAVRARATLGEISRALESIWGRHVAEASVVTGAYAEHYRGDAQFGELLRRVERFDALHGRRPRLLVAKLGQDGHDRGARLVASGFADAGFDVDVAPLFQTPAEVARQAVDNDVHAVGISTQAGAHVTLVPSLIDELSRLGASDVVVVCGGIIPDADRPALLAKGVAEVLGPGTPIVESVARLLDHLEARFPDAPETPAPAGVGAS